MSDVEVRPCEVCNRERPIYGVFSSGLGIPMSFGLCQECYEEGAEPDMCFEYLYSFVATDGEGLHESIDSAVTYKDGSYCGWPQWKEWRKNRTVKYDY